MYGEDPHGSIVQRGIDEALACQDMLERTPAKPSWWARMVTRAVTTARVIAHRRAVPERKRAAAVPHGTQ
jgi:hypothetical protein